MAQLRNNAGTGTQPNSGVVDDVFVIAYGNKTDQQEVSRTDEAPVSFSSLTRTPSFNGGDAGGFSKWINQKMVYPESANAAGVQGKVTLSFKINSDVKAAVADNSPGSKSPDIYEEPTFPAENVNRLRKDRRLSLGLNLSSSASGSNGVTYVKMPQLPFLSLVKSENNSTNIAYDTAGPLSNYSVTPTSVRYVHDLPLGVGLTASLAVSKRFSIESGQDYTYLHSVEDNNGIRSDQSLHFIGIPLRAEYKFIMHGGFSVYAGAGASVEKCVKAAIGGTSFMEHGFQCSAEAFAGAEYRILKNAGLYFQPTVSYWFTETVLVTYRTENPLTFSLNAGLRFHL